MPMPNLAEVGQVSGLVSDCAPPKTSGPAQTLESDAAAPGIGNWDSFVTPPSTRSSTPDSSPGPLTPPSHLDACAPDFKLSFRVLSVRDLALAEANGSTLPF